MSGTQMVAERQPDAAPASLVGLAPAAAERAPVFERLHALVRKGYRPELGVEGSADVLVLRHPGRAPDLVLRTDGTLEELDGGRPRHKRVFEPLAPIAPGQMSEQLRFMQFLDRVPRITLRDRTRRFRRNFIYWPAALIVIWLLCMGLTVMIVEL